MSTVVLVASRRPARRETHQPAHHAVRAPMELAEIVASRLGLTGALGTEAEVLDGAYTGRLDGRHHLVGRGDLSGRSVREIVEVSEIQGRVAGGDQVAPALVVVDAVVSVFSGPWWARRWASPPAAAAPSGTASADTLTAKTLSRPT